MDSSKEKIKIFHFHNGSEGGVFTVIKNLIINQQSSEIENHIIYTIPNDELVYFDPPEIQNLVTHSIFRYSKNWNFYFTCRKLAKLLPDESSIIIAHDWLELGMVSLLGLSNPVVQVMHGDFDYYYNLSILHNKYIDLVFCVSSVIAVKTYANKMNGKIIDWRFPVSNANLNKLNLKEFNIAFFVANLKDERKNYTLIPKIDKILINNGIYVNWFIAGGGLSKKENNEYWPLDSHDRVRFFGMLTQNQLNGFLENCDAMILPSKSEGLPVSVVEAMKRGIVPFIPFWDGAMNDLVINGQTGFYVDLNDEFEFAQKLVRYYKDLDLRAAIPTNAKKHADRIFNPLFSVIAFENEVSKLKPRKVSKFKAYGSRLDRFFLPNFIVTMIRRFLH
jgi:glycosyltransferase involved in cell wall biosynthesis